MTRTLGTLAAVAAVLSIGTGCVSCRHTGYAESLCPATPTPYPPPVRQQVFLFMMNGSDLFELSGMLCLRDKLCHAGYPQVYYAQRQDVAWYNRELRRVARDEPGGRILLLGYGTAAERVLNLAHDAVRDGLPIDSVILLDPIGVSGDLALTLPVHSVVIRSHHWRGGRSLEPTETITAAGVGHYSLPNSLPTVEAVVRLMTESAGRVRLASPFDLPHLPLTDKPAPTPRPIDPATLAHPVDEWDFLKPLGPFPTLPGAPPASVMTCPPPRFTSWLE